MPSEKKFDPHKGFYGWDDTDGDVEFLKEDASPWDKVTPDDTYHARRFNDSDGHIRGSNWADSDSHEIVDKRPDEHQASIRFIGDLIDRQSDQPAGKMLGGGGPVSDNERDPRDSSWRGSGRKGPRYSNPPPASVQANMKNWKR